MGPIIDLIIYTHKRRSNGSSEGFPVKIRPCGSNKRKKPASNAPRNVAIDTDPAKGYNVLLSRSRSDGSKKTPGRRNGDNPFRPRRSQPKQLRLPSSSAKRTRVEGSGLDSSCRGSSQTRKFGPQGVSQRWNLREAALCSLSTWSLRVKLFTTWRTWQCEHDLPYKAGLSEDILLRPFHKLGLDQSSHLLFRELAVLRQHEQQAVAFEFDSIPSTAAA